MNRQGNLPAKIAYGKRASACLLTVLFVAALGPNRGALGNNLAEGKPYELSPAPSYGLCTDAGDARQLTDGEAAGANWTQPSTVGWAHVGRAEVTIDLGKVESIGRVCAYTVGGGHADVYFPAVIAVLVSENGNDYSLASAIGSGALVQDGKKSYPHKFETADLNVRGRYVRLLFQSEERYLFLDEIEVFSSAGPGRKAGPAVSNTQLNTLFKAGLTTRWVAAEWLEVKDQIKHRFQPMAQSRETILAAGLLKQMQDLDEQLERLDVSKDQEVAAFRAKYLGLRAKVASPVFGSGLIYWEPDPWADLRGSAFPTPNAPASEEISRTMWQDEYEHIVVGVTNLDSQPTTVKVELSPLLDENNQPLDWTGRLWLRQARAVPVAKGYRVLDALPLATRGMPDRAELIIPAGESLVLWLSFYSLDLSPGRYQAKLDVQPVGSQQQGLSVPVTLTVVGLQMPKEDEKTLNSYMWDYIRGWGAAPEAAADLRSHGVNTFILHPESLPQPRFNGDRTKIEGVDFKVFDEALACTGNPRMHGVFWGEGPADKLFDLKQASEQELFKQWIRLWAKHLEQKGYGPDRYFFYPYDEKVPENFVPLARLIKEVDPRLQVYCNQVHISPEMMARIAPYIDIWCPYYRTLDKEAAFEGQRDERASGGSELTAQQRQAFAEVRAKYNPQVWTYAADGPARTLSPAGYYRNLSWLAFANRASGAGFWCYLSSNNTWDDYDGTDPDYCVIYYASDAPPDVPKIEPIIPSRRWEACREGAEDYEYLHRLQETIRQAQEAQVNQSLLANADRVQKQALKDVLLRSTTSDYNRARVNLTNAILDLRKAIACVDSGDK